MELLEYNWLFTEVPANYSFILILIKFKADLEFLSTVSFQVFVFLAAEYETPKNSLNQVSFGIWLHFYFWVLYILLCWVFMV